MCSKDIFSGGEGQFSTYHEGFAFLQHRVGKSATQSMVLPQCIFEQIRSARKEGSKDYPRKG